MSHLTCPHEILGLLMAVPYWSSVTIVADDMQRECPVVLVVQPEALFSQVTEMTM
jgi:hypothetical protein